MPLPLDEEQRKEVERYTMRKHQVLDFIQEEIRWIDEQIQEDMEPATAFEFGMRISSLHAAYDLIQHDWRTYPGR